MWLILTAILTLVNSKQAPPLHKGRACLIKNQWYYIPDSTRNSIVAPMLLEINSFIGGDSHDDRNFGKTRNGQASI